MSTLQEKIMNVIKEHSKTDTNYVNPYFVEEILEALSGFYELEDDDVEAWLQDMFGR